MARHFHKGQQNGLLVKLGVNLTSFFGKRDVDKRPQKGLAGGGSKSTVKFQTPVSERLRGAKARENMTETNELLEQGIAALNAGGKAEARSLLMQVVEQDEHNEMAWLWLSGAVDTDEERRICLENVLAINPNNVAAQRGIEALRKQSSSRLDSTSDAESLKDKPATQSVVETRKDIKPQPSNEGHRPEPRAKGRKTSPKSAGPHGGIASDSHKPLSTKETIMAQKRLDTPQRRPRRWSAVNWIMLFLILLLAGTQVWMFDRVSRLEKALTETQAQTVVLANQIATLTSKLDSVDHDFIHPRA